MFLRSLALENVRSIERLELDFASGKNATRPCTLLLGENGAGKTSVLQAAALILAGSDALPALLAQPDNWIRSGASAARIIAKIITPKKELRTLKLELKRGRSALAIIQHNQRNLAPLDSLLAKTPRNFFVASYEATRNLPDDLLSHLTKNLPQTRGLLLIDELELHLHPKQQRQLLLRLRRELPRFQVLASTQSPFIAQQAEPGALHVLEGGGARQIPGDPRLLRLEQLLEPLFDLPTSESLAAESVRAKHRALKTKRRRNARETSQLQEMARAIRVLPEAQALEPEEKARLDLLARIAAQLSDSQPARARKTIAAARALSTETQPPGDVLAAAFAKISR